MIFLRFFLFFLLALFLSAVIFIFSFPKEAGKKFIEVEIGGKRILAEIASTPYERSLGLSGRKNLADFGGMIFLFDHPGRYAFWMKSMRFPIDIFWIRDGVIVDLEEYVPMSSVKTADFLLQRYEPDVVADTVLETKAGFALRNNIRIGDRIKLTPLEKILPRAFYPVESVSISDKEALVLSPIASGLSRKVLKIDFASQAPLGVWDSLHEEACEETDILMTDYFLRKIKFSPEEFDKKLTALISLNDTELRQHEDIGTNEIVKLANSFNKNLKAESKKIFSLADIKNEIDRGLPVIAPVDAKKLANPHYGPAIDYHTVLVVGYSDSEIITHDSGTKFGKNYRYHNDKFWEAISDLGTGAKNVVVFQK